MDFPETEKKILKFWREKNIFEKLREKIKGKKPWSFLDGPITANNPMGVHHAWGRTYKDVFQRFMAMRGFDERFQNGFDCQGLWVEVEVEKELGFGSKKDIEEYGLERFVEKCKERVGKYSKIQTAQSIRLGQWMDWENSYYTMSDENNYAIWHFLKKCSQKGLLYKGHDVVPWCPRCGTAISQHEILGEEYQEITHKAIYVKFQIPNNESQTNPKSKIQNPKTYFLVWTTTPWTLPGNVALAVQPELEYAKVKDKKGDVYILLNDKASLIPEGEIIEKFRGEELKSLRYQGLFDGLPSVKQALEDYQHSVILWKEVTEEEGTGIVHIAPGCGEEDFQLSKDFNLPVIDPTDNESRYKKGFGELSGRFVYQKETRDLIFKDLEQKNRVFKIEDYQHRYPTCWRCKTELIFRLVDEWYIKMDPLRAPLIKTTRKIKWIPSFGLDRELDWLKNMKDWLISKKRYWGLALPIFECLKCGNFEVIGSKEELKEKAVEGWQEFEGHSPHRPWVDKVKIKCSKCNQAVSRIPDVGNPWLDAGIVPFSTMKYFQDRTFWKKWFPADLVCESFPGQFKNWFYSLLVMSQVLERTNPFRTLFGYSLVVDEKGEEMHKSKGNAIWFDEAVEKMGADVMRWLYVRQNPFNNLRFGFRAGEEIKRKLLTLENSYRFFETYSEEILNPKSEILNKSKIQNPKYQNVLDRWIVSRMNGLVEKATKALENYEPSKAALGIEDFFINDLSLWYIRRSRKRFPEQTLYWVLLGLTKLLAPMMPFFAEEMYQDLKNKDMPESVHLCDWPQVDRKLIDKKLEKQMDEVREIVAKVLAKRTESGIRVRQPLQKLKIKNLIKIKNLKLEIREELLDLIKEETNIKEIVFDDKIKEEIELDTEITPGLKEEGQVREIIRHVQDLRKKAGLTPKDRVDVFYSAAPGLEKVLLKNKETILKETRSNDLKTKTSQQTFGYEKNLQIDNQQISFAIRK